jgi:uncharacterized protein (TIGR02646 family)
MKQIVKGNQPNSLAEHKQQEHASYENYADKDGLRAYLHSEQRGICCYCMASINPTVGGMKIEHFKCQDYYPELQLDYQNLLGACKGGEGQPRHLQHCDTYKGSSAFDFDPTAVLPAIDSLIWYGTDGSINSDNSELNRQLNDVLNLNNIRLINNRKAALDAFTRTIAIQGPITKPTLLKWLGIWKGTSHRDNLSPYCMVIVFWINKKLKRFT